MPIRSLRLTGARLAVARVRAGRGRHRRLAQDKDLSMGNVNPPKHGTSQASQQFADKLAELTGGKIKIAHHHSGALGGEREVAQQIQLGAVDFGPITTAPLSTLIPEMSVFQLPYIFRDYDHVFKALDGSDTLTKYYDGVLDKKGLKLDRLHRRRLPRHLRPRRHQFAGRRQGQEGARAGGQDPGRHLQGARHDLHAHRLPGGRHRAADQGDRFRRGRRQHLLPQQVLRHRQVRGRRAPHPPGDRADHVQGRLAEAGCRPARRPSWTPGRTRSAFNRQFILDEDKSIQDQVRGQGRHHHQARRHAVPAGDAERLRGVLRHARRQGRQARWSTSSWPSSSPWPADPSDGAGGRGARRASLGRSPTTRWATSAA